MSKVKQSFVYGGKKMELTKSTTEAAVQMQRGANLPKGIKSSRNLEDFTLIKASRGLDARLDTLRKRPDVQTGTHVYYVNSENDIPYIPTGRIYIEFLADSNVVEHYEVFEKWHLTVQEMVFPGAYRVQVTPLSPNPIKCVIGLQKHKKILIAEPDLATIPIAYDFEVPRGNFANTQWHYENTGTAIPIVDIPNAVYGNSHFKRGADSKVKDAWRYMNSLGSKNIKIAVIDMGFDMEHPMLFGDGTKIRTPFNAVTQTNDAGPFYTDHTGQLGVHDHGTSCAAVAAGYLQNGIIGTAPNARIIPIRLDSLDDRSVIRAFNHAMINGADIITCSIGYPSGGPLGTDITNAISKVARTGRGGRGIPIFIAAGNANPASNGVPRQIGDLAGHSDVFCITASNSLDEPSSYSFFGANALLCAPTNGNDGIGITTATVEIINGGVEHTYTSGFGGTSSATPLAAGVAALMLSVNPNLTVQQMKQMMRTHTDRIPGDYNTNGHSARLGYGRINALKLVKAAHEMALGAAPGTAHPTPTPTPTPPRPGPTPPVEVTVRHGVVTSKTLNIRSQPVISANNKVGQLTQGMKVEVFEIINGWYKIGIGKYVHSDFVRIATAEVVATGRVISTFLNVRSKPTTDAIKVRKLNLNDRVQIKERTSDNWLRIGDNEWVLGIYVRME
jgi:subtilisin family serine protease